MSKGKQDLNGRTEGEQTLRNKYELQITEGLEETESEREMKEAVPEETVSKATRKRSAEPKAGSRNVPTKRKTELRALGPAKEPEPWDWITLNRCLMVASFVALLSMGFQVLQDVVDNEDEMTDVANGLLVEPEIMPPEIITEDLPEPWFFETWFQASEVEPEEAEEDDDVPVDEVEVELKKIPEKPKSPQKRDEELEKRTPGKEKQGSPPVKLEKTKPEKTSKAPALPKEQDQPLKTVKPWKLTKEVDFKKEKKSLQNKKLSADSLLPPEKGKMFLKDREKKSEKWDKPERNRQVIQRQKEELKNFLKKGQSENRGQQERRTQRENKWPRKENPRGINGSSKLQSQRKFFPQKDEDRHLSPKHKHGVSKTLD